jgi:cytochrome c oxidase assembly protein subunit 11
MNRKLKIALLAGLAPTFMFGMAWAAVPLYQLFCQITGYGGTTRVATQAADQVLERTVLVRFDANTAPGIPWTFRPEKEAVTLKLGENGLSFYNVTNTSDRAITAVATYNVTPHKAGPYFQKLECFCFQDRTLLPGESMDLPVIFYVDPRLATEDDVDDVREITLSYTFFPATDRGSLNGTGSLAALPVQPATAPAAAIAPGG